MDGQRDVLAFHPRHDLTLLGLPLVDIARIMNKWIAVYRRRDNGFEAHPHGQVWSLSVVPSIPCTELASCNVMRSSR